MGNMGALAPSTNIGTLIATSSPSGTGVVTFSSIPQIYRHLRVLILARGTQAAVVETNIVMTVNNDTTSGNYAWQFLGAAAASPVAAESTSDTGITIGSATAANAPANSAAAFEVRIEHYTGTTFHKPIFATHGRRTTNASGGTIIAEFFGAYVATPAAVTRLDFTLASGNYVAGSLFCLYGIP